MTTATAARSVWFMDAQVALGTTPRRISHRCRDQDGCAVKKFRTRYWRELRAEERVQRCHHGRPCFSPPPIPSSVCALDATVAGQRLGGGLSPELVVFRQPSTSQPCSAFSAQNELTQVVLMAQAGRKRDSDPGQ